MCVPKSNQVGAEAARTVRINANGIFCDELGRWY